jgi:hypothetical protein
VSPHCVAALILLAATSARADPASPLLLPDLVPRTELAGSVLLANAWAVPATNDTLLELDLAPRVRIARPLEAFADLSTFHMHMQDDDYGASGYSGIRNVRLGVRAVWPERDRGITAAVSVWSWLPTATTNAHKNDYLGTREHADLLRGLPDPYAMYEGFATGGAIDLRWSDDDAFVQGEVGATIVRDLGQFETDDALVAIGGGSHVSARTSVVGELRVLQQPTGAHYPGYRWWSLNAGVSRSCEAGASLGLRIGIGFPPGNGASPAFLLAVDGALRR